MLTDQLQILILIFPKIDNGQVDKHIDLRKLIQKVKKELANQGPENKTFSLSPPPKK